MNPKISAIVPVHNAALTLVQCVESLCRQTVMPLEILLVVNGCSDQSLSLAYKLSHMHNIIRVIELDRPSVTLARKKGLEESEGDYLIFSDSDDWYKENALEILADALKYDENIEIVNAGYEKVISPRLPIKLVRYGSDKNKVIYRSEWKYKDYARFYNPIRYPFFSGMCASLYSRSLLLERVPESILGNSLRRGEDIIVNAYAYDSANAIAYIVDPVYCYRFGGITSGIESLLTDLAAFKVMIDQRFAGISPGGASAMTREHSSYVLNVIARRYQNAVACSKKDLQGFYEQAVEDSAIQNMASLLLSSQGDSHDTELASLFLEADGKALYRYSKRKFWRGRAVTALACRIADSEKGRLAYEYR